VPTSSARSVVTPLVQSVAFDADAEGAGEARYPRHGNTPNAEQLQRRLAALEGADAAMLLSSGQGATACALLALVRPGDHVLASAWVYGGTRQLLTRELPALGIDVTLVNPTETRVWRRHLRKRTRAVFVESPVNPTCRVLDLAPVSYLTRERAIALVVDSTFASPVAFRPLEHGADVVIHSATKFLNGHHDVLGGVVLGTAPYVEEVRQKMVVWGQAPDPFAVWLLERGLKTLDVRVRRQSETAGGLAEWCAGHPAVAAVHYPGLATHPDHAIACRTLDLFGGMLALELAGGAEAAEHFVSRVRLFRHAPSLGGVDSLVSLPHRSSHALLTDAERAAAGIAPGFVRLSVGLEHVDDLAADLAEALA